MLIKLVAYEEFWEVIFAIASDFAQNVTESAYKACSVGSFCDGRFFRINIAATGKTGLDDFSLHGRRRTFKIP